MIRKQIKISTSELIWIAQSESIIINKILIEICFIKLYLDLQNKFFNKADFFETVSKKSCVLFYLNSKLTIR